MDKIKAVCGCGVNLLTTYTASNLYVKWEKKRQKANRADLCDIRGKNAPVKIGQRAYGAHTFLDVFGFDD
jgi:hypothetical protein